MVAVILLSDVPMCWTGKFVQDKLQFHDHCLVVKMTVTTLLWHGKVTSHAVAVEAAAVSKAAFVVRQSSCF